MIKINGQCISTLAEFRSFFDADAMGRIGGRIADDSDLFADDVEYGQVRGLLRALAKDEGPKPVLRKVDKRMALGLAGTDEVLLAYNIPHKDGVISRQNARKLLVGEIAAAEVELDEEDNETIHTDAGKATHLEGMNGGRNSDVHSKDKEYDGKEHDGENLQLVRLHNKSVLGETTVDIGGSHTYAIPPGTTAFLLKCGDRFINKLPQFSVSSCHACLMKYGTDGGVTVVCIDHQGRQTVEKQFKAEALQQVCADRAGGFVALIDGQILTYSREVQPDDVSEMFLPDDEHVVMIRLTGQQIVALTDHKRVYSNSSVDAEPKRPVLWIGQNYDGTLNYIYEDSYTFPGDVDVIESSKGKYVYDKGELKNA